MHRRKIQQRRWDHTDIRDLATRRLQPFEQRAVQARRTQAAIAAQIDARPAVAQQVSAQRAAKIGDIGTGEFSFSDSANIVLAEDSGFEHSSKTAVARPMGAWEPSDA